MAKIQKDSPRISLCMIVRDEEFSLENTLSTARPHVDQIIVVDTGSIDETVSIANQYADRIENFTWIDDFSAARNYSLQFAIYPWILVLDADEIIAPDNYAKLREAILNESCDGFMLTQRRYTNNHEANNPEWRLADEDDPFSKNYRGYVENPILRLFKNDDSIRYSGAIHEIVDWSIDPGRVGISDVPIHHYHENPENGEERHLARNLQIQELLIESGKANARDYLAAAAARFRQTGDIETAEKYLRTAEEMGANRIGVIETLAEIYYLGGRLQSAFELYRQLYESNAGTTAVLNNLSNLFIKLGDLKSAAYLLRELLERGIEDPIRRERVSANLQAVLNALGEAPKD